MFKNILAAIGLAVVVKKGFDFYNEYQKLKKENDFFHENINQHHSDE